MEKVNHELIKKMRESKDPTIMARNKNANAYLKKKKESNKRLKNRLKKCAIKLRLIKSNSIEKSYE